ncbi:hypothetical protein ACSBM8_13500 [Sphingomonas sp. ASY06-1R]|jgi:hypothetical protein|uniref:hypothetical protein n=1 Tax=Sphingomonas sp. ASY06-1R TaxID=3445771 RepID=UPI003FA32622
MQIAKLALVAIAALVLAGIDYLLVVAAFLGDPDPGAWLLLAALCLCVAGFVLRMPWLPFVAQNGVIFLSLAHAWRGAGPEPEPGVWAHVVGLILLGNLLVWPLASSIRRRAGGRGDR